MPEFGEAASEYLAAFKGVNKGKQQHTADDRVHKRQKVESAGS